MVKDNLKYEIAKRSYSDNYLYYRYFDSTIFKIIKICELNAYQILIFNPERREYDVVSKDRILSEEEYLTIRRRTIKDIELSVNKVLFSHKITLQEYLKLKEELCQD